MMGLRSGLVLGVAACALLVPGRADAQVHRSGAGFTVAGAFVTDLNSGASSEALAIAPGAGGAFGLHADRWYGAEGRVGLRYQGTYQRPSFDWTPGERRISALSGDVSVLFRLTPPRERDQMLPYISAGIGGIWYDLGTGDPTAYGEAEALHDGHSRVLPAIQFGAGVDLDAPWDWQGAPMRLRIEVADHVSIDSPIRRDSDGERYGAVHHVRLSVGLHSVFDFIR